MVISQQASVCWSLHLMEVLNQDLQCRRDQNAEIIQFTHEQIKLLIQEETGKYNNPHHQDFTTTNMKTNK